jgi:hypothetical protein
MESSLKHLKPETFNPRFSRGFCAAPQYYPAPSAPNGAPILARLFPRIRNSPAFSATFDGRPRTNRPAKVLVTAIFRQTANKPIMVCPTRFHVKHSSNQKPETRNLKPETLNGVSPAYSTAV